MLQKFIRICEFNLFFIEFIGIGFSKFLKTAGYTDKKIILSISFFFSLITYSLLSTNKILLPECNKFMS